MVQPHSQRNRKYYIASVTGRRSVRYNFMAKQERVINIGKQYQVERWTNLIESMA
jgi:hypothetical protein